MQVFVTVEIAICAMRCRRGVIAALKNPGLRRSRLTRPLLEASGAARD